MATKIKGLVMMFCMVGTLSGAEPQGSFELFEGVMARLPFGLRIAKERSVDGGLQTLLYSGRFLGALELVRKPDLNMRSADVETVADSANVIMIFRLETAATEDPRAVRMLMIMSCEEDESARFLELLLTGMSHEEEELVLELLKSVRKNKRGFDPAG